MKLWSLTVQFLRRDRPNQGQNHQGGVSKALARAILILSIVLAAIVLGPQVVHAILDLIR